MRNFAFKKIKKNLAKIYYLLDMGLLRDKGRKLCFPTLNVEEYM